MVKKVIEEYFESVGKVVDRSLCEHFPLTRQELFDVVAVHGYTSFDQVVEGHGRGRGCDVCKPAIASILASLVGGHVLEGPTRVLQDTNDAFLANIQRNGSYSVVPRIPGGEITPEKLIVIGEVARDFGLYTKITGGQRIDLFGARVEELPAIWRRLVDAGFESGHAYGKALRTVKSCVGSTWCRYGVQDSVQLAIDLELRYRGLRSPHKLKGGVSGCARECAEARGKDFGVIATEKGWNLYVGGNGGATPVHARLLAGDLDTETLVRYLDRFLMYYIRTADRLQRTAPWVDSLEGGLDRVREVVVDDALGLGTELEAAMARHVDGYRDEWAATLADPEKLRRFVSFVNAPDVPDPHITFRDERDQAVPGDGDRPGRPRPHDPGRCAVTTDLEPSTYTLVCRLDDIEVEGGVAALVDGEAVAIVRTHDGNVFAISNYDPCSHASVLARGIVGSRSTAEGDVPFVASPMHKQAFDLRTGQCLDDADVRIPTYDVRVLDGGVLVGPAQRRPDAPPAHRLPDRRHGRPEGRRAGHPPGAPRRRRRLGARAVHGPEPGRRRVAAGGDRGRAGPAGRPVPGHDRHRDEGVVRRRRVVGSAAGPAVGPRGDAEILARGPKSVGCTAPARAARAVGTGLRVLRRRARPPARTGRSKDGGSWCRSTASRSRWSPTRYVGRVRTSPRSPSTGSRRPRTPSRCSGWSTWSRTGRCRRSPSPRRRRSRR